MKDSLTRGRAFAAGLACLGTLVLTSGPAQAKTSPSASPAAVPAGLASCPSQTSSQAFLSWADSSEYTLVSGSSFAGAAPGWTLSGGAKVVSGGEPYGAAGSVSQSSLALPAGASAQSPLTCVDGSDPTWRFFAGSLAGSSSVEVSVVYQTSNSPVVVPVGVASGNGGWQPSPVMQTGAQVASALQGGTAQIALRFTGISGTTNVDDVFIDPRMGW